MKNALKAAFATAYGTAGVISGAMTFDQGYKTGAATCDYAKARSEMKQTLKQQAKAL